MPHLAGIKFYIFPLPAIHSPTPSHQSNTINITLADCSLWLYSLVLLLVFFLDTSKPWTMIYNQVKTMLLACLCTWSSLSYSKYLSLPALVFLTIFYHEFLSAVSSSVRPLIDCHSEKILFFLKISSSSLLMYLPCKFMMWTLTSEITSSVTFRQHCVLY